MAAQVQKMGLFRGDRVFEDLTVDKNSHNLRYQWQGKWDG